MTTPSKLKKCKEIAAILEKSGIEVTSDNLSRWFTTQVSQKTYLGEKYGNLRPADFCNYVQSTRDSMQS